MEKKRHSPSGVFWLLTGLSCLTTICLQMTVTALPLWTVNRGYDTAAAGLSTTVCTLTALFFRPAGAGVLRRWGEKNGAVLGAVLYVAVFLLYLPCSSLWFLLVLRAVQGVGMSLLTTSLGSLVTACLAPEDRTQGMGYFGLGNAVALSAGPSLGLLLSQGDNFQGLFLAGAALSGVILVSLLALRGKAAPGTAEAPEESGRETGEKNPRGASFWKLSKESGALWPSGLSMLLIFCQMALSTCLSFWGKENGMEDVSLFFTVNLLGMIVSRLFLGNLCRRVGERIPAVSAAVLLAVSYLLLGVWMNPVSLWISGVLYGFGYGILYALLNGAAVKFSREENRAAANAVFFGAKDLGTALGSAAWGAAQSWGLGGGMYGIGAGVSLLVGVFYARPRAALRGKKARG